MPKGLALTIGLNSVDPQHYAGWSGNLNACEADAEDMAAIARSAGFSVESLLTRHATRKKVIDDISEVSKNLEARDIFLLSYAGHGGQLPDRNNDEDDGEDETWCLFDGQLVDDELYSAFEKFKEGVRILVFSDSCHSGTITRFWRNESIGRSSEDSISRFMPNELALRVYRTNRSFYDRVLQDRRFKNRAERNQEILASVLLISGCQDFEVAKDGTFNGFFTGNLLRVWNNGVFLGNYWKFYRSIRQRMVPHGQTPNYFRVGKANKDFESQQVFTI